MASEHVYGNKCLGEQMFATGGLPSQPAGYTYITLCRDVWFLDVTESGGLVCFVTVGGGCLFGGVYDYVFGGSTGW